MTGGKQGVAVEFGTNHDEPARSRFVNILGYTLVNVGFGDGRVCQLAGELIMEKDIKVVQFLCSDGDKLRVEIQRENEGGKVDY